MNQKHKCFKLKGRGSSMTRVRFMVARLDEPLGKLAKNNLKSLPWPLTTGISYLKESIDKEWNVATLERTKIFPEEDAIELIQERFRMKRAYFEAKRAFIKSMKVIRYSPF